MRQLWMILAAASLLPLAGCGSDAGTQTEASTPTVTYQFNTEEDYSEIAERAEDYCDDEFDGDAMLVDRKAQDGYTEATFACR